jgi:hypothetical protein
VQVIVDADTRLVIAAARPVPGTTADAHAWRASGLSRHCQGVTVLGDGAYLNCGMAVPHRKRPGRALLQGEEDDNAEHRKVRARVEHAIGRMNKYKILRDCRQRGDGLHHAVQAVAHSTTSPSCHEQTTPLTGSGLPEQSLVQHPLVRILHPQDEEVHLDQDHRPDPRPRQTRASGRVICAAVAGRTLD